MTRGLKWENIVTQQIRSIDMIHMVSAYEDGDNLSSQQKSPASMHHASSL